MCASNVTYSQKGIACNSLDFQLIALSGVTLSTANSPHPHPMTAHVYLSLSSGLP